MEQQSSSSHDDRGHAADRGASERSREQRSGEGAESALANLKKIERDRERARPADEYAGARH